MRKRETLISSFHFISLITMPQRCDMRWIRRFNALHITRQSMSADATEYFPDVMLIGRGCRLGQ